MSAERPEGPARVSADRLARLLEDSARMSSGPHQSFLAEVLNVLTAPRAPDDAGWRALRLLAAMWDSPYARRPEPQAALNDVGQWLESRLRAQAPLAVLALEVGWLRWLARYQSRLYALSKGQNRDEPRAGAGRQFGHQLPKEGATLVRPPAPHIAAPGAASRAPAATTVPAEPALQTGPGLLIFQKNDSSLRARLEGGPDAWARGEEAQALLAQLSEETRARLRKGKAVTLRVSYRTDGNSRRLIALAE